MVPTPGAGASSTFRGVVMDVITAVSVKMVTIRSGWFPPWKHMGVASRGNYVDHLLYRFHVQYALDLPVPMPDPSPSLVYDRVVDELGTGYIFLDSNENFIQC